MVKVAVVTGSNKGIGFATVRGLCKQFDGDVILTSRDVGRGEAAVEALKKEGLSPKFHQLDIEDKASVEKLKSHLVENYGGLDILVNNAAIAYKDKAPEPFSEQAERSLKVNYFDNLHVYNTLMPVFRAGARIVNVSSFVSHMTISRLGDELKARMLGLTTVDQISTAMQEFVSLAKAGTHKEQGWPDFAYGVSKLGMSLLTKPLQEQLSADTSRPDMIVNAVDPGWVNTDMSSHSGTKNIDQGADSFIYCALLPPNTEHPKGEFVADRIVRDWTVKYYEL